MKYAEKYASCDDSDRKTMEMKWRDESETDDGRVMRRWQRTNGGDEVMAKTKWG